MSYRKQEQYQNPYYTDVGKQVFIKDHDGDQRVIGVWTTITRILNNTPPYWLEVVTWDGVKEAVRGTSVIMIKENVS